MPRPIQVLELAPGDATADAISQRLTPVVEAKREAMKEEMIGVFR